VARSGAIGVGLVGYGLAGRVFHAPCIAAVDGLELAAIVTTDPDRRTRAGREHPSSSVVDTVDALLRRADVDVVVVATPNRLHAPIARQALAAGRHVVVDKPIAMDSAEALSLIDAAGAAGRTLTVYQNRRWDSDFLTVQRLITEGALGPIDSFESRFERMAGVGPEWRESAAEAGGPLRDLGAHLVDQCLLLFGPVRRVFAQIDRRRPGSEVGDAAFVALDHVSGARSRLWTSLIASRVGPRLRVRGLLAEYVKDDLDIQESQLLGGMPPDAAGFGDEPAERWGRLYLADGSVSQVPTERGTHVAFYELLRDALRTGGPPPVDPMDSLRALRVLEAAERSALSGQAETVTDGPAS
jgi:predicted dehydrogenase